MRVLIVDDEVNLRFAIERRLRKAGMDTGSASTVRHAIDRLRNEAYDVVLCDLRMPGGNGTQLLQWLGSYSPSTKIIVVSAFVTPEFRKTYQPTGSLRIFEKPVDLDVLVEMLEGLGPRKGFYGNAIEVELFDYVQMIALSGRDKLVEVTTPAGKGLIWFEHGDIVHVEYDQYRGEMAFYRLLSVNRGTFKEVFNREPPMRTVVRSSTHLLMEAARRFDEGILFDDEPAEANEETTPVDGSDDGARDPSTSESGAAEVEDVFAEPDLSSQAESVVGSTGVAEASSVLPIVDDDDLVDPFAEPRSEGGSEESADSGTGHSIEQESTSASSQPVTEAFLPVAAFEGIESAEGSEAVEEIEAAFEGIESAEATVLETVDERLNGLMAEEPEEPEDSAASAANALRHAAMFDDPDMRAVMLEQFWQFDGINGVAIISSTGKVLAEDMRNNGSLVTLAGFYMRGAARIARTLGYNVFDGVVARSMAGQQMVMVSMGAASAVLSVEPGTDPEAVRDAVMGVE